jgi:hypothetical protein
MKAATFLCWHCSIGNREIILSFIFKMETYFALRFFAESLLEIAFLSSPASAAQKSEQHDWEK